MSSLRTLIAFLLLVITSGCAADDPGPKLAAGFAVRSIAPTATELAGEKVFLGAYGLPLVRYGTGVHDDTQARAMAISAYGEGLLLIALDAPVLSQHFIRDVSEALRRDTGLAAERILIGATHSHSAPDLMGLWGGVPDDYRDRVVEQVAAVGREAWRARVAAVLEVRNGKADNRNRRGWNETDESLTLLTAEDLEGKTLGALVSFAAHPVFLDVDNTLVSRDFCGPFVDALQKDLGAPVVYFNGIVGDASPSYSGGDPKDDEFTRASGYGEAMATRAASLAQQSGATRIEEGLTVRATSWKQVVDNAYFTLAEKAGLLGEFDVDKTGGAMAIEIATTYFSLGEGTKSLQAVTFPGEALTRTGLAIKDKMSSEHKLLLGLTRATLGYFIRADEWKTGKNDDYEETVSPGPDAGETAITNITALIAGAASTPQP
jgi:hypothetical protein